MDRIRLEKMLNMTQETLKTYLLQTLLEMGRTVHSMDGFLYSPGTTPVLLCAHMDTVYNNPPSQIIKTFDGYEEVWSAADEDGIGGDDRCGIEIILEILEKKDVGVVFLEDEEIGGKGAYAFTEYYSNRLKDDKYNYIIEIDRQGINEAVFYDCVNNDFTDFILEDEYFVEKIGSFSDISIIAPAINLSAVNLSAGYINEHCGSYEKIFVNELDNIKCAILDIINKDVSEPFEYKTDNSFSACLLSRDLLALENFADEEWASSEFLNEDSWFDAPIG